MLDETTVSDTISANPATEAVSTDAAPQTEAPVQSDPSVSGDTTTAAAPPEASAQDRESSLTSQTGSQDAKPQAQTDWERKFHEAQKGFGRMRSEYGTLKQKIEQYQKQYDGIDPQTVQTWKQAQERAKQEQLPKWHQKHPEAPRFKQQYQEYTRLAGLFQRAKSDEAKAEIGAELEQFPAEVRQQFQEFNNHRRTVHERIAEEMTGYNSLEEMIADKASRVVQEQQERAKAEQNVDQWFDSPANQPLVEYARDAMTEALNEGVPLPYVQAMAKMRYELDALRSRVTQSDGTVVAAQARTQAAKANAAITRDTAPGARRADPVAVAKERNIEVGSTAFATLLQELNSKGLL